MRESSHREFEGTVLEDRVEQIRSSFPILSRAVHEHPLVYLDNAASSQKPDVVIDRISRYYREQHSNVHRGVHALSQEATDAYEEARDTVCEFIGADDRSEIIFTKGTTDAINLVAFSYAGRMLEEGDEIVLTQMEHHSNIVPWQLACEISGAIIKVVPVEEDGSLNYEEYEKSLSERTRLVAVTHVSNSLGTVNPVKRMISDAHGLDIPVLIDGAQAVSHMPVNVCELDADFYCFSGHKMYGPTGIGVLYGKQELLNRMPPYQGGGDMIESVSFEGSSFNSLPHKFEAGTPNIAGAIGLAAAMDFIRETGFDFITDHETRLLHHAHEKLQAFDRLRIIGTAPEKISVVSFLLGDSHPYDVATLLDRLGIAVRSGHHCTQPVMARYGIPGTVRASFALYNTIDEIDVLAEGLERAEGILF